MKTFDGMTFDEALDGPRLSRQLDRVMRLMTDGEWRTLRQIADAIADVTGRASEAGVSARLRDLRKPKFGHHTVERRRVIGGLHEYRLTLRVIRPLGTDA